MTPPASRPNVPLIARGARGAAVRDVQRRLVHAGHAELAVDGAFGPDTDTAVRDFQRRRGLAADGIVGPETWRALVDAGFSLGDRLLWHSAVLMRGDDVLELQQRLNQLGFDAGPEDGLFGPLTRGGVEELQRNIGIAVDGLAGPVTVQALRRLHRDHHAPGLAAQLRQREALRRLAARGLSGARLAVDPALGPDAEITPSRSAPAHEITWAIANRTAARLSALGAQVTLTRGPRTTPTPRQRARLANELAVDVGLSISVNAHGNPVARGAASYYFGSERLVSDAGRQIAALAQRALLEEGFGPDCRSHARTWTILRETRMPFVVVEPGFVTAPEDAARLADPVEQDRIAGALTRALRQFLHAEARGTLAAPSAT
ncbi:MAG: peptidoglycan-binding protein [Actinomycetota bacterium]